MLQHLKNRDQKTVGAKGFTLIELLVVIVILGILAAVVVFAVSGITDRGQKSACATEGRTIRTAQEAYFAEKGQYAASGSALATGGFLSKTPTLATTTADNAATPKSFTITTADAAKCPQADLDS